MKFFTSKTNFYRILGLIERISGKSSALPILSSVLIKAENGKVYITSTNLEVGLEMVVHAKTEKNGVVVVPTKTLLPLFSSISDETITLDGSESLLRIISQSSSTSVKCLPAEEFPILPRIKKENAFIVSSHTLVSAFRDTLGAVSTSYTRPELASVYMFSKGKTALTFVATDSFRLAEEKVDVKTEECSLLIPYKNAQELLRVLEDIDDDVEIIYNKNQVVFQTKEMYFVSRLTEGEFPNYHSIIPEAFGTQIVIEKNQLQNAVRAASVFSSRLSDVLVKVIAKEGVIEIRSHNTESGEHSSLCRGKVSGEDIESTFNYSYLLEALRSISREKIFMGFNGSSKPVLLRGEGDQNYLHLVMPMRGI